MIAAREIGYTGIGWYTKDNWIRTTYFNGKFHTNKFVHQFSIGYETGEYFYGETFFDNTGIGRSPPVSRNKSNGA